MHLVQIFLPLSDNDKQRYSRDEFQAVEQELVARFKGFTAYPRAPASGLWQDSHETQRDELVVYEVMTDSLDTSWWKAFRARWEQRFRQEKILIRTHLTDLL
jgi:hypothetical protein